MMGLSPAGNMLSSTIPGLGNALAQQVTDQVDEERKRRERELAEQRAGLSPAGRALSYGGAMLSF
jgi:hypothetical protein